MPLAQTRTDPEHRAMLEWWMHSYRPEELFTDEGSLRPKLQELAPRGERRMGAAAATYAVPRTWRERYGVRRYGFHGLSHA